MSRATWYCATLQVGFRARTFCCTTSIYRVSIMKRLAAYVTAFVALSHVGIMILEMFFWDHPVGREIFGMTPEVSASSAVLAMNQGLYNGFLAAGLIWGLMAGQRDVKLFFLACVVVAGIFGGLTAKTSIMFTQGLPALIAFALVYMSAKTTPSEAAVTS